MESSLGYILSLPLCVGTLRSTDATAHLLRRIYTVCKYGSCALLLTLSYAVSPFTQAQAMPTSVLHSFGDGTQRRATAPDSGLILASDSNFYGVTSGGGEYGYGTVYRLTLQGSLTVLHSFGSIASTTLTEDGSVETLLDIPDGAYPTGRLVQGRNGYLYGITTMGGDDKDCRSGCGTVFRIGLGGDYEVVHYFASLSGVRPYAGLSLSSDGSVYGTASSGGFPAFCTSDPEDCDYNAYRGYGTIFRITPEGIFQTVHVSQRTETQSPSTIIEMHDGSWLGVTTYGGRYGKGSIFKLGQDGSIKVVYSFGRKSTGREPNRGLYVHEDGSIYGTTSRGGKYDAGTIFKIKPDGKVVTVHHFDNVLGAFPTDDVLIRNGNFLYGSVSSAGDADVKVSTRLASFGGGAVFSLNLKGGQYSIVHKFDKSVDDGDAPEAGLCIGSDGKLYLPTTKGGTYGFGAVVLLDK